MGQKIKSRVIIWIVGMIIMIVSMWPLNEKIRQGLDLRGGMYLVVEVDKTDLTEDEQKDAVERALEVIRNRIDQFGVEEPTILKQGHDRIVIQLPEIDEEGVNRAINIIKTTAFLEFRIVNSDTDLLEQSKKGNVPENYELLPVIPSDRDAEPEEALLVKKQTVITGESLVDAAVEFDESGFNEVVIGFELDRRGARKFARATRENVGERLAIVLDGKVQSAPVIREEIPGGRGRISGSFTMDEAKDLAIALRAGALPAPIQIIENRTVGASLGKDSIDKGLKSGLLGLALVVSFIIVYYRGAGVISVLALLANIVIVFGTLAMLGAVLTLPGIAGIILTIGMAVDANVLIFERIREEIAHQKSVRIAISTGYGKAFLTILDANVTTLIGAAVLYYFGSGPVRGFAVTLSIGIVASMLTAIYGTRLIFDILIKRRPHMKHLSI